MEELAPWSLPAIHEGSGKRLRVVAEAAKRHPERSPNVHSLTGRLHFLGPNMGNNALGEIYGSATVHKFDWAYPEDI